MKSFLLLIYFFQSFSINILIDNYLQANGTSTKTYSSIESALEKNVNESNLMFELRNIDTLARDIRIFQKSIYILYVIRLIIK